MADSAIRRGKPGVAGTLVGYAVRVATALSTGGALVGEGSQSHVVPPPRLAKVMSDAESRYISSDPSPTNVVSLSAAARTRPLQCRGGLLSFSQFI